MGTQLGKTFLLGLCASGKRGSVEADFQVARPSFRIVQVGGLKHCAGENNYLFPEISVTEVETRPEFKSWKYH